jgi:hypothetical protein
MPPDTATGNLFQIRQDIDKVHHAVNALTLLSFTEPHDELETDTPPIVLPDTAPPPENILP